MIQAGACVQYYKIICKESCCILAASETLARSAKKSHATNYSKAPHFFGYNFAAKKMERLCW
jgi:hypothetical protein